MQPPDRNFPAPDSNASPNSNTPPLTPPSLFEPAPAPSNVPVPPAVPPEAPLPIYVPGSQVVAWEEPSVLAPLPVKPPVPGMFSHRVARWRWAMSLLLIGLYPVFVSLLGKLRPERAGSGPALPSSVRGLILYSGLELGVFGIFWLLGWAFSRATKDELLLRWRGGLKPILQGFGYAFALRLGLVLIIAFVAGLVLTATGMSAKDFEQFFKQNQPQTDSLFSKTALANPLYLLAMTTILSFVVAGLREELWRTASLAALRHILPDRWSETHRWIWAIAISSVVFGLGHIYQGGIGVIVTAILGAGLGAVTWRHRSIWPSVFAHGFIDATSFLAAAAMASKKLPIPAFWWHG